MSEIKITQDYTVTAPKEKKVYPIYHSDWERVKTLVTGCVPCIRVFQILYSISFSIFVSAIFALLAFKAAQEVPLWIQSTNNVLLGSSFIIGIALVILDNQQKRVIQFSINMVINEMQSIERNCNGESDDQYKNKLVLGVQYSKLNDAAKGCKILKVHIGFPAYTAGLLVDDIIKQADNIEIDDWKTFAEFLQMNSGKTVKFLIIRDSKKILKTIKLNSI